MKTCSACGCINDTVNRYCRNCGTCFDAPAPAEREDLPVHETEGDIPANVPESALFPDEDIPADVPEVMQAPVDDEPAPTEPKPIPEVAALPDADEVDPFFKMIPEWGDQPTDADKPTEPLSLPDLNDLTAQNGDNIVDPLTVRAPIDFDFSPAPAPVPASEQTAPRLQSTVQRSTHLVIDGAKRALGGGWALLALILLSASLVCEVLLFMPLTVRNIDIDMVSYIIMFIYTGVGLPGTVVCMIGGWIQYAAARSRKHNYLSTKGFVTVKVGCILQIVLNALVVAWIVSYFGQMLMGLQALSPEAYLFFGGIALLYIVVIVRCSFALHAIGRIRRTAASGEPHPISGALIAVYILASLLHAPLIGFTLAYEPIPVTVYFALLMAYHLALALAALRYRRVMKTQKKQILQKIFLAA